jgi:chromosomal replication initiator protein
VQSNNPSHSESSTDNQSSTAAAQSRAYKATIGFVDSTNTFDTFIVGSGTQFAHAAAKGVAMQPGSKYNPLVIYGPSGLGKTHLLHSIANGILKDNPNARICYLSAEQFVNDFIRSIQDKTIKEFQDRYRSRFDVFLIDDIQFFANKEHSSEEFFHTFSYLCAARNQVVITSDKAPKELVLLEERLISRLQQGLVVDVRAPDLETRIAILRSKAEALDLYLPDDVCLLVASHIRSNVRELEGALVRLSAEASINGTEITLGLAREALADVLRENRTNNITVDSIIRSVSQRFQISIAELHSKSRKKKHTEPRQIAMYLCRKYTKKTYQDIAQAFGGKDHTTVIHAIGKIERNLLTDSTLKRSLEEIQQLL